MCYLYLLLAVTLLAAVSIIYHGWRNGITPMPSSLKAADIMVNTAAEEAARLVSGKASGSGRGPGWAGQELLIIETGSGWGGIALAIARRIPNARIVGYENSPIPFLFSVLRARITGANIPGAHTSIGNFRGCRNVEFRLQDYRQADLNSSDIIVSYLFPRGMQDLARLIESENRGGGADKKRRRGPVIISNTFALPGREPDRRIQSGDAALSEVHVYRPRGPKP